MKLWIPGANGLVGKALLKSVRSPMVGTGREVDIADLSQCRAFVKEQGPFTHIVNCAAFSQVDLAEVEKDKSFSANVLGPANLAQVAKETGLALLHLSTDYVFDGVGVPLTEEDVPNPCNHYGKTKLEGERRVFEILPTACVVRTSWVFGDEGKNFVAKLLELLQTKEELKLVRDQFSRPTYVFDLCAAIVALLDARGLFHFASGGFTNKYDFTLAFMQMAKELGHSLRCNSVLPVESSYFSSQAKRPLYSVLDTKKVEKMLPFPIRHWSDSVKVYLHAKTR